VPRRPRAARRLNQGVKLGPFGIIDLFPNGRRCPHPHWPIRPRIIYKV